MACYNAKNRDGPKAIKARHSAAKDPGRRCFVGTSDDCLRLPDDAFMLDNIMKGGSKFRRQGGAPLDDLNAGREVGRRSGQVSLRCVIGSVLPTLDNHRPKDGVRRV